MKNPNARKINPALPDPDSIERLSQAMSFRISRLAAINERAGTHRFKNEFGLSLSEWRVIGLVAESSPATTSKIRKMLLLDRGLLSRTVKELCSRNLLITEPSPKDRRQTLLFLTDEGRALHQACIKFTDERNRSMASVLTAKEQEEFGRILDLMIDHNAKLLKQGNYTGD
nr:MarR family winged helix-turn-helix transcriptional regulator [Amylibacter sp.]